MMIMFKNILLAFAVVFVLSVPSAYGQTADTAAVQKDSVVVMVYTTFVIDQKGRVKEVEILQTECDSCTTEVKESCEKEALRTINDMPRFSPSKGRGKSEPVRYNLPVRFIVAKDQLEQRESPRSREK